MMSSQLRAFPLLLLAAAAMACTGVSACDSITQASPAAGSPQTTKDQKEPAYEKTIKALIKQLGDDSFEQREAAQKRLAAIGEPALKLLSQAAKEDADAEVRQRAGQLVQTIGQSLFFEVRRFAGKHGGKSGKANRIAVTPDGRHVVSAGSDALCCWDVATGKQVLVFGETQGAYWGLAVSADGKRVIAGTAKSGKAGDAAARVFDLATGKMIQQFTGHKAALWGTALLQDGKHAVTGGKDQSIRVWDVESGKEIRAFEGVKDDVRCLASSPDGKLVVVGHMPKKDAPGPVRIWDVEKGKEIRVLTGHTLEVSCVAFSPDGKTVLSSSFDKTVRLWDVATGKELKKLEGHPGRIEGAAFTPDGKRVVSCGEQGNPSLRLWDVATGQQILESAEVPPGFVAVAALPDGRHCVTAGRDGVVRLWQWTR